MVSARERPFSGPQDDFWQNLVLGMIGETIDMGDEICGARVVDKCSGGRCMYRLELWFRKKEPQSVADELLGEPASLGAPLGRLTARL